MAASCMHREHLGRRGDGGETEGKRGERRRQMEERIQLDCSVFEDEDYDGLYLYKQTLINC